MANKSNKKTENESLNGFTSNHNSFERKTAVIDSIVATFKNNLDRKNSKNKKYVIWIDTQKPVYDDLLDKNANGLTLKEEIIEKLSKIDFKFGSLELRLGIPEENLLQCTEIVAADITMYLDIVTSALSVSSSVLVKKARLSLAAGSPGALKQQEGYLIDNTNTPYNIGRVIEPGDSINRINHIEIVDETRLLSSRSLAHIGFSETIGGFYIQREKPTETNRVEIIRETETRTLNNESAVVALKDGDKIKLRQIILDFHIVSDIK